MYTPHMYTTCTHHVYTPHTLCVHSIFNIQESFQDYQALEDKITLVATKVVYLGDQLESANVRRGRAEEAKDILTYLEEFKDKAALADIFMEPSKVGVECIAWIMYS